MVGRTAPERVLKNEDVSRKLVGFFTGVEPSRAKK